MYSSVEVSRFPLRDTARRSLLAFTLALCAALLASTAQAGEPAERSLQAREDDATSDTAIVTVVAESFASYDDAAAYVRDARAKSGIDLEKSFARYGYEVTEARTLLKVAQLRSRLRTAETSEFARWVMPTLCLDSEGQAHAAAKKLGLEEKGFHELAQCHLVAWPKPVTQSEVAAVVKRAASAGYDKVLQLDIADVVIILGKALTPPERAKIEALAKEHRIPVRTLQTAVSPGD